MTASTVSAWLECPRHGHYRRTQASGSGALHCRQRPLASSQAWTEFGADDRMKPGGLRDRVVDVAEELFKFSHLLRGQSEFLVRGPGSGLQSASGLCQASDWRPRRGFWWSPSVNTPADAVPASANVDCQYMHMSDR